MNGKLALRMVIGLLGGLALLLPVTATDAVGGEDVYFFDDFNGSALDATRWDAGIAVTGIRYMDGVWTLPPEEANYGSITVADSRLSLENPSPTPSCPMFPLIWSNHAIPPNGNFELEFRMRYTGGGFWGDGVRIVKMPSPFEPAPGGTESAEGDFVLMIHQDNVDCKGPNVSLLGHPGEGSASLPFNTDWHTYTLRYEAHGATLYIDGVYFDGPLPAPRPNCIQLGVGDVGCCGDSCATSGCRWTSYEVDYFKVRLLAMTPTRKSTWGDLKSLYRR